MAFADQVLLGYLKTVVGPTPKLHFAFLLVKGEPRDVNLAGAFKYSRRNIRTAAVILYYYVCLKRSVETLVSTVVDKSKLYTKHTQISLRIKVTII